MIGQRSAAATDWEAMRKQVGVLKLISAYRVLGARQANLDPLKRMDQAIVRELDPATHGLTDADMAVQFNVGSLAGPQKLPLSDILSRLKQTYCGNIGVEYMHITQSDEKHWVQKRFEGDLSTPRYDADKKKRILKQITAAETLERYLHTKYVGQKRFAGRRRVRDRGAGPPDPERHRAGRAGTDHRHGPPRPPERAGQHPGQAAARPVRRIRRQGRPADGFRRREVPHGLLVRHPDRQRPDARVAGVQPVPPGNRQPGGGRLGPRPPERRKDTERKTAVPVLIHGDSAFGGLGVNQGTFNLSQTRGYGTGGTIHIVINNQVGFTTSDTRDIRSTMYCTDVAKMIEAPILHVNGDDPEAVCYVMQAALDYRMTFKKDVVIDLVCYRKLGHNEGDDPFLTQPMMYKKIAKHQGVRAMYAERLVQEGVLKAEEADAQIQAYRDALDKGEHVEQTTLSNYKREHALDFSQYLGTHWAHPTDTSLPQADIQRLTDKFTTLPEGFKLHPTVQRCWPRARRWPPASRTSTGAWPRRWPTPPW